MSCLSRAGPSTCCCSASLPSSGHCFSFSSSGLYKHHSSTPTRLSWTTVYRPTPTVIKSVRDGSSHATLKRKKGKKGDEQVLPDFAELEEDDELAFLELELESSFPLETVRHYEVMFLVHEDSIDELQDVIEKVQGFIKERKGKMWRLNDWGLRGLAYKIKKASRANYILMNFELGSQAINDFKSLLDKDERVIRHIVSTQKNAITTDSIPPPDYYGVQEVDDDLEEYDTDEETDEEEEGAEEEEETWMKL